MIKTIGGTRYGACHQFEERCTLCGKEFVRTALHVYRSSKKFYCSYTCYKAAQSKKANRSNNHVTGMNERKKPPALQR